MYSASSMSSHMSAISYVHKVLSAKPNSSFYYKENFQGVSIFRSYERYSSAYYTSHITEVAQCTGPHCTSVFPSNSSLCSLFVSFPRIFAIRRSCSKILAKVSSCSWTPQLAGAQIIMRKHKFPFGHIPAIYSKFPLFCTVNALFEYLIALNIQVVLSFRQLMRVQFHIQKSQLI